MNCESASVNVSKRIQIFLNYIFRLVLVKALKEIKSVASLKIIALEIWPYFIQFIQNFPVSFL